MKISKGFIIWVVIGILGVVTVQLMNTNSDALTNSILCNDEEEIKQEYWSGTVDKKFLDTKNHNYKTVQLNSKVGGRTLLHTLIFSNDESGVYDFAEEGDSLFKAKESLKTIIIRNGNTKFFLIDLNCEE